MQMLVREGGVRSLLACNLPPRTVGLAWLGQAGFALRHADLLLLIDPYLSDHLAQKYRGTRFPHVRMMPPPIDADTLGGIDAVLCTHRHGDHMDPGLLPVIARNNPRCRFVVPRAEREAAAAIGLPSQQTIGMDAGDSASLAADSEALAIPSAHEVLKTNDRGEHHFLGFILRLGEFTLYHSGDCVPYEGLASRLREARIDVALLPVNGRDPVLQSHGVLGNMTLEEAAELCQSANIPWLVPHHFGMFEFNTVDPQDLQDRIVRLDSLARYLVPEPNRHFLLTRD